MKSSYSTMTDNPLVEAVAQFLESAFYDAPISETHAAYCREVAEDALRAIEDAGYTITPTAAPSRAD